MPQDQGIAGRVTVKIVPPPAAFAARIWPRCAVTTTSSSEYGASKEQDRVGPLAVSSPIVHEVRSGDRHRREQIEGTRVIGLNDRQLLELQADALFTHDARGRIRRVNEPDGDRAPRFFFARSGEGAIWRCRDDLPHAMVRDLDRLAAEEPSGHDLREEPRHLSAFVAVLEPNGAATVIESGPAYRFPTVIPDPVAIRRIERADIPLLGRIAPDLDQIAREFERREPRMAVIEDGAAVCLCYSARLTDRAAEAGVMTLEAYRGRGYAPLAVAAWARAVRASGRIPLYSTSWDNRSSQAVARRLGLIQYGTDLSIE